MLKKVLVGLAAVVVVLVIVVLLQPSEFRIARSISINAPPATVFGYIDDFRQWEQWSPYAKLDPNAKNTFEGPATGEGAMFSWSGNSDVGEGKMTIVKSDMPSLIRIQLDFLKPMQATNIAEFTLESEGAGTKVTWAMTGKNGFMGKAFCMLMNMDKMVGGDFEKGLATLKTVSETPKR